MIICIVSLFVCKQKSGFIGFVFALVASTILVFLILQLSFASLGFVFFVVPYSIVAVFFYSIKYSQINIGGTKKILLKNVCIRLTCIAIISLLVALFAVLFAQIFVVYFTFLNSVTNIQLFFIVFLVGIPIFFIVDYTVLNVLMQLEKSKIFFNTKPIIKDDIIDVFENKDDEI